MADVVRLVLLVLLGAGAAGLGHWAVRHWWRERLGRAYELPVDRTGTVVRAGAAGVAAVMAGVLALIMAGGPHSGEQPTASDVTPAAVAAGAPPPPAAPPARTPEPAPPAPAARTIGHPAGGVLEQLPDGTRVWLPPRYTSPRAARIAFPVALVHLPAASEADLFAGFARAAQRGLADPFVLVLPTTCSFPSTAHTPVTPNPSAAVSPGAPATPGPGAAASTSTPASPAPTATAAPPADDLTALAEAARRYRLLTARTATAVIGAGADAPCAVNGALATPGRFGAAAGISGLYPPPAPSSLPGAAKPPTPNSSASSPSARRTSAPRPSLLLTTAPGETAAQTAARRLRDALHPGYDQVRLLTGPAAHRDLYAQVAAYFTEKLDGPATTTTTPSVSTRPTQPPSLTKSPAPASPPHPLATHPTPPPNPPKPHQNP